MTDWSTKSNYIDTKSSFARPIIVILVTAAEWLLIVSVPHSLEFHGHTLDTEYISLQREITLKENIL